MRRAAFGSAKRIVVKVGSRLLADSPAARPATIADEIAALSSDGSREFVVVSSGAISLGVRAMGLATRPHKLPDLQAAAAIGQGRLLHHWEHAFAVHSLRTGQVLLTHDDLANRRRFLNARHALRALLDAGVIPVVNENDTVAVQEIKYGDNDLLGALVGNLISADALIILTDVEGLLDASGERIPIVTDIDNEAAPVAGGSSSDGIGSGGMSSKVQAAKIAARSGIPTAVVPGRESSVIARTLAGDDIGTLFTTSEAVMTSRKHWIAYGAKPTARIVVDAGARVALCDRGRSLLPAGVTSVEGDFGLGDIVSLVDPNGIEFARGLAGYSARDLERIKGQQSADIETTLGYKYLDEVIHRDDLVLL
jgi:glutamate 5-kinase